MPMSHIQCLWRSLQKHPPHLLTLHNSLLNSCSAFPALLLQYLSSEYEEWWVGSLTTRRQQHGYIFIYKALLGKIPRFLCTLLCPSYQPRSSKWLLSNKPCVLTDLGILHFHANSQRHLKLGSFVGMW